MKMSKKLLSLFLALVMAITSCSVGFTAFAADGNRTDSNDDYWNGKNDASAAYQSLELLVKDLAGDAIPGLIEGASPSIVSALTGLLGGGVDKDALIPGYTSDTKMSEYNYSYLNDPDAEFDFFSLYGLCDSLKDNSDKDIKKYANDTLDKLNALLPLYNKASQKYLGVFDEAINNGRAFENYGDYLAATGGSDTMTKDELRALKVNGVAFGDCEKTDVSKTVDGTVTVPDDNNYAAYFIDWINETFYSLGSPERAESIADAYFYFGMQEGNLRLYLSYFMGLALMGGADVKVGGQSVTWDNYTDFNLMDVFLTILPNGNPACIESPYYVEMCLGFMVYSGEFGDLEACKKEVEAAKITEKQLEEFCEHLNVDRGLSGYPKKEIDEYLQNGDVVITTDDEGNSKAVTKKPFSDAATEYLLGCEDNNIGDFYEACTANNVNAAKNFVFEDGDKNNVYIFANGGEGGSALTLIDRINAVIASELIISKFGDSVRSHGTSLRGVIDPQACVQNYYFDQIHGVKPLIKDSYEYDNVALPKDKALLIANASLNGVINMAFDPTSVIGSFVDINKVLADLLDTEVDLQSALQDVWINLYENPTEEIIKLLPILVTAIDELIVPIVFNNGDANDKPGEPGNVEGQLLSGLLKLLDGKADIDLLNKLYYGRQDVESATYDDIMSMLYETTYDGEGHPVYGDPKKSEKVINDVLKNYKDGLLGIGAANLDLNKSLVPVLKWLTATTDDARSEAGDMVGYYNAPYETSVPNFTNIYVLDKLIAGANINDISKKLADNKSFQGDNAYLADVIEEAVIEIASFATDAVDIYVNGDAGRGLAGHKDDLRYNADGTKVSQSGLNNIFVALPQIVDIIGQLYIEKYEVDSDWTYTYNGKIDTEPYAKKAQKGLANYTLIEFKNLANGGTGPQILDGFVNILIGNIVNGLLDILNDTISDENNKISKSFPLIQGLLNDGLGGLGEKSLITDVLNGLFQLKRKDNASFTLTKQPATGFTGFSNKSGIFLLSNLFFVKNGQNHGLVPWIKELTDKNNKNTVDYNPIAALKTSKAKLASSSKVNKSAAGSDYDKLLSKENLKAAEKLVDILDTLLSSLLNNTTVNGFTANSNDGLLSGVVTVLSAYLGAQNVNDIAKLLNNYLYYITGESHGTASTNGKIGTQPKDGKVDASKVYTPENLSNLVIQTYSLVENIVDYLFYNSKNGFLNSSKVKDSNMLVGDAVCGVISPDAVAIRLSDGYSATKDELSKSDRKNWNSYKVEITDANWETGSYTKDYLKFSDTFKGKDNKQAFYDGLGESLNGIAAIVGVLLTKSYTDNTQSNNYYSAILNPVLANIANATGAKGVLGADQFNKLAKENASQMLVKGVLTPLSNIFSNLYGAPASFLLNVIKGAAGVLDDDSFIGIVKSALAPIQLLVKNAAAFLGKDISNLSPTLAAKLPALAAKLSPALFGNGLSLPTKDVLVTLLNNITISKHKLKDFIELPSIDWKKLAAAKTPAEVLLLIYGYLVDTVLNSDLISGIIDSLAPGLTKMLKQLSAVEILNILNEIIAASQSPTEVFWTFREYVGKITNTFVYPKDILASDATKAVGQLDDIVTNVFPLLNALGVTDIESLNALVNDKLYTNDLLTKALKGIYGALNKGTAATIFNALGMDLSPKGLAKYLTNKSYGRTYTSAAAKLRKAKSWDKVGTLNWGFKDGSSKAEQGFIYGISAVLRPFNDILSIFLAEGNLSDNIDLVKVVKTLDLKGSTNILKDDYAGTLDYTLKNGMLTLGIRSNVKNFEGKKNPKSIIEIDLVQVMNDLMKSLRSNGLNGISLGTNGYESAVIPLLEAFMCDGVKTYKQYKKDYKKAKDNLLVNVIKPVIGLVDDITKKPFDTVTKILPNVAYFIESNGVAQVVGNILAPITSDDGLLGILRKHGFDLDKFIKLTFDKDLGTIVNDLLGIKSKLKINLTDMSKTNVQVIVVPLINSILKKNNLPITLPDISFKQLASHGTIKVVKSAARNREGKFRTRQVQSRQGETLVAVLRYVSNVLIKNASGLSDIICGIEAVQKNETITKVVQCVFTQIGLAKQDDIVRAVFYFLTEQATDKFFDYSNFTYKDNYTFSWGDMDEEFCRKLAPMLDGMIGSLLEGGLAGLVSEKLYTDELVGKLATGLYGAVEGVNINDDIGSLTNLLAMTDIDFTTGNVAKLLVDGDYGRTYPDVAAVIRNAGSWSNVKAESLKFGVNDRDSFLNAVVAVLRPIFGVLDVILNDASLNIFDLVKIPGSDGYSSTIVPLLEAFGVYNIKTQYQYREDCYKAYDNVLLDIINPLWDKVEDILNAPLQTVMSILPNLSLFFANDGLLQIVDNLLTPVSALLEAIRPIVDINKLLDALGLDVPKLLKDKVGLSLSKFDLYDLPGTLSPLVGADNVVNTVNSVLGIIKIKDNPLGLELPDIDWFQLASHGEFITDGTSQVATYGKRIYVVADEDETLIALLRFLINTINYKDNYNQIVGLITGLLGDNVDESLAGTINDVLGMLKGDADQVISDLVELLQQIAG
ncbi:MAG: hypothetical protein IKF64_00320 [Eubacterium sp.]|nr:hypothetical protein [Eubacterium sp.]